MKIIDAKIDKRSSESIIGISKKKIKRKACFICIRKRYTMMK